MLSALTAILGLVQEVVPLLSTSGSIGTVISSLTTLLPTVVQEGKDLAPVVSTIISTLRSNGAITPAQLDQLDALESRYDDAFDAAATAATAEDDAAAAAAAAAKPGA